MSAEQNENSNVASMADASDALEAANATPSKGKYRAEAEDQPMADADTTVDDDDDEDEDDEEDDEDDGEGEEDYAEIDPSAILAPGTRRSARGARVDYSSAEALARAGLKPEDAVGEDDEEGFKAPDDEMQED